MKHRGRRRGVMAHVGSLENIESTGTRSLFEISLISQHQLSRCGFEMTELSSQGM